MTPTQSRKRDPIPGSVFPRDLLAANIKAQRNRLDLSQKDLAERMSSMHHVWSRPTVSQVEKGARPVSVDELYGLSLALNLSVLSLLAPVPDESQLEESQLVDVGSTQPIPVIMILGLLGQKPVTWAIPLWDGNTLAGWRSVEESSGGLPAWLDYGPKEDS